MEDFFGFEKKEFEFEGKKAVVVFADKKNRTNKWLLKTEYFGAFPELEIMMLKRGYNLAHVENETRWCLDSDTKRQGNFCEFLEKEYGFSEKCVPVGMSCGGMQAVFFAAKYPKHTAALYLDAPVINFLSCPAALGKSEIKSMDEFEHARKINLIELLSFRNHPLDRFSDLTENKIPIILVSGDSDTIVPFDENGKLLYEFYRENGGEIELHIKKGGDHHPHGLENNEVIAEFIETHY